MVRLGEEAVRKPAGRHRTTERWPEEDVCEALSGLLVSVRLLSGVIATLGELRYRPAIPYIISALEDDVCRKEAEEALLRRWPAGLPGIDPGGAESAA